MPMTARSESVESSESVVKSRSQPPVLRSLYRTTHVESTQNLRTRFNSTYLELPKQADSLSEQASLFRNNTGKASRSRFPACSEGSQSLPVRSNRPARTENRASSSQTITRQGKSTHKKKKKPPNHVDASDQLGAPNQSRIQQPTIPWT